jgi:hypothetical protein
MSAASAGEGAPSTGDSRQIFQRRLVKEPEYAESPRYVLLAFGVEQPVSVWMVEDGRKLYLDRNANGDLTDDGPPQEPGEMRTWAPDNWDFAYNLKYFVLPNGSRQTAFRLARWNYGPDKLEGYGLSVTLDGQTPMYAGWTEFWSESAASAEVIHFGGRLRPILLRSKEFVLSSKLDRLSIGLVHRGANKAADSRLSIDALPASIVPEVTISWPVATGEPALQTRHLLTERCCYWEFYTTRVPVPGQAVEGTARVALTLPGLAVPIELEMDSCDVPVRAQPTE